MPVYSIQTPGGKVLDIEAGDEATALRGAQEWHAKNSQAAPPPAAMSPAQGAQAAAADASGQRQTAHTMRGMEYATGLAQKVASGVTANWGDEIAAGIGAAGAQLPWVGSGRSYREILGDIRRNEERFSEQNPWTATAAEAAGALAPGIGTAVLTARAVPWLTRAPSVIRAAIGSATAAAPLGAVSGAGKLENPEGASDYAKAAGKNALLSGAMGLVFGGAGHAVGNAVGPWATAAAQRLHQAGVRLTPGEIVGGYAKRVEDGASSWPFIGQMIRNRQAESSESLNRAAWNQALSPLGRRYALPANTEMGHEAAQRATDTLNRRYAAVVPRMQAQMDAQLTQDIAQISQRLPQSVRPQFADAYRRHVEHVLDPATGAIDGRGLQHALGALRDEARRLQTSQASHAYDHDLGVALNEMRDRIVDSAGRYTPQRTMTDFNNIQRAYRNFAVLRDAASRTGAEQGVFNPTQFHAAVRAADTTAGKGATARGEAVLQNLSGPAKAVMTRRVADSGTPERAALLGAILNPALAAKGVAAGVGPGALYTRTGNALFRSAATAAPAARATARNAIQRVNALLSPMAGWETADQLQD